MRLYQCVLLILGISTIVVESVGEPSAPTLSGSITATSSGSGNVFLAWTSATYSGSGISISYHLSINSGASTTLATNAFTFVATRGILYDLEVTAYSTNGGGNSGASNSIFGSYQWCNAPMASDSIYLSIWPLVRCAVAVNTELYDSHPATCVSGLLGSDFHDAQTGSCYATAFNDFIGGVVTLLGLSDECLYGAYTDECRDSVEDANLISAFAATTLMQLNDVSDLVCTPAEFSLVKKIKDSGGFVFLSKFYKTCAADFGNFDTCISDNYSDQIASLLLKPCGPCVVNFVGYLNTFVLQNLNDNTNVLLAEDAAYFCGHHPFSLGCRELLQDAFDAFEACSGFPYPQTFPAVVEESDNACNYIDGTGWFEDSRLYEAIVECAVDGTHTSVVDCFGGSPTV